jgi:hypothetical protein
MSNSIRQIPVEGNIDYIALEKVCDDLRDAHKLAVRALDEIRVRYWLRGQDGLVTAAHAADVLFGNRPQSKSLSMSMAKYLKAAGWKPVKKVQGTSAERVS